MLPPFLGYSPPGIVEDADLMYANYGTVKDFQKLEQTNLSCTGKIIIMRYGKIEQSYVVGSFTSPSILTNKKRKET